MLHQFLNLLKQRCMKTEKKLWVFTSFGGQYSDNPKYISIKLHEIDPTVKIVWLVKKEVLPTLPSYVTGIDINSEDALRYRGRAEVCIDNVYGEKAISCFSDTFLTKIKAKIFAALVKKKSQHTYTTWHGTPLKRMGRDQIGNTVFDFYCPNTTMVLGNQFTLDIMQHLTFGKIQMQLLGTPRNDILFSGETKQSELKMALGLPMDKKILLYAPTFRNDGKDTEGKNVQRSGLDQLSELDFPRLFETLSDKFGGDWVFVCRFHYHVAKLVDWARLNEQYNGKIINGNDHDDMSEYMVCADMLMTDASSCMFDYSVTGRPCFLYFPDLEHYQGKERGFYLDVNELPFPVATDCEGLIERLKNFDLEAYQSAAQKMQETFGYVDDSNSSQRIVNYMLGEHQ